MVSETFSLGRKMQKKLTLERFVFFEGSRQKVRKEFDFVSLCNKVLVKKALNSS